MGFMVRLVAVFPSSPKHHVIDVLDSHFGSVEHETGSKTVTILEHAPMTDEADAVEFVRSLALESLPDGAKITEATATPDE